MFFLVARILNNITNAPNNSTNNNTNNNYLTYEQKKLMTDYEYNFYLKIKELENYYKIILN